MDDPYSSPYDISEHNNVKAGLADMYMSAGGKVKNNVRDYGMNTVYNYDAEYTPYDQNSLCDDTRYLYSSARRHTEDSYKSNGYYGSDLPYTNGRAAYYLPPTPPMQPIFNPKHISPQRQFAHGYRSSEDQLRANLYRDGSGEGKNPDAYFKSEYINNSIDPIGIIVTTINIVPMLALLLFILIIMIAAIAALSVKLYGFVHDSFISFTS